MLKHEAARAEFERQLQAAVKGRLFTLTTGGRAAFSALDSATQRVLREGFAACLRRAAKKRGKAATWEAVTADFLGRLDKAANKRPAAAPATPATTPPRPPTRPPPLADLADPGDPSLMNPRWVIWLKTLAAGNDAHPYKFLAWMNEAKRALRAEHGWSEDEFRRFLTRPGGQDDYTEWLANYAKPAAPIIPRLFTPQPTRPAGVSPDKGRRFASGEVVQTASGRKTLPFPRVTTGSRATAQTLARVAAWLIAEALKEAKATSNDHQMQIIAGMNVKRLSPSDMDTLNDILFGWEDPDAPADNLGRARLAPISRPLGERALLGVNGDLWTWDLETNKSVAVRAGFYQVYPTTDIDPVMLRTAQRMYEVRWGRKAADWRVIRRVLSADTPR